MLRIYLSIILTLFSSFLANTLMEREDEEKILESKEEAPKIETALIPKPIVEHDLQIIDFVLTSKIEKKEPKDTLEAYTKDHNIAYAFARMSVTRSGNITFVWTRDGKEQSRFTSPVRAASHWRTFSSVKLTPGNWKVQLISKDKVLSEKTFTVG